MKKENGKVFGVIREFGELGELGVFTFPFSVFSSNAPLVSCRPTIRHQRVQQMEQGYLKNIEVNFMLSFVF